MKVSLVLTTINRTVEVERFLESLVAQTSQSYELIIIDQNKDDRILRIVDHYAGRIRDIIHMKQAEAGDSKGKNLGLTSAHHEIVGFPDDDCIYAPDLVERVMAEFSDHPDLEGITINHKERETVLEKQPHLISDWKKFRMIPSPAPTLFLRSQLIKKVGQFDERLGPPNRFWVGGEIDFVYRCLKDKAIIYFVPYIFVSHPIKTFHGRDVRRRERSTGALWKKHRFSYVVILRGLLAPLIKISVSFYSPAKIGRLWNTFLGRLEGYRQWES